MAEQASKLNVSYARPAPANVNEQRRDSMGLLDRTGLSITRAVGTMGCAIAFAALALISLPTALRSHNLLVIIAWIAQTFLQLVLLPIIMVGQNVQGRHSEIMADEEFKTTQTTYQDLEHLIAVNQRQLELLERLNNKRPAA